MRRRLIPLLALVSTACNADRKLGPESEAEGVPAVSAPQIGSSRAPSAPSASARAALSAAQDKALRRTYAAPEMKLMPCLRQESPALIDAKNCATGFVVYGPYAVVPPGSDVELTFEVEALDDLAIYSELVSEMGVVVYGSVPEQTLEKGSKRTLGQRVRIFSRVDGLEARLVVRAEKPVSFKLRNLSLKVH